LCLPVAAPTTPPTTAPVAAPAAVPVRSFSPIDAHPKATKMLNTTEVLNNFFMFPTPV
jgi:hypothetical protein